MADYDWVFKKGYANFDNQSECEDFIRWAIDEIKRLKDLSWKSVVIYIK